MTIHQQDPEDEAEQWRDEAMEFAKMSRLYANLAKHHARKTDVAAYRAERLARIGGLLLSAVLIVWSVNLAFSVYDYLHR